jgi:hypothetical protein
VRNSVVALILAVAIPAAAQENTGPRVEFGFAAGSPGRNVTVPFSLAGGSEKNVARIVSSVTFRGDVVVFVRLDRAGMLDEAVEMKGVLREPPKDQKSPERVVDITVSSTREATKIGDGILGYLVFRIDPKADVDKTPEVVLAVESKLFAHTSADAGTPLAVAPGQGRILLEHRDVPIIACFFYMH